MPLDRGAWFGHALKNARGQWERRKTPHFYPAFPGRSSRRITVARDPAPRTSGGGKKNTRPVDALRAFLLLLPFALDYTRHPKKARASGFAERLAPLRKGISQKSIRRLVQRAQKAGAKNAPRLR